MARADVNREPTGREHAGTPKLDTPIAKAYRKKIDCLLPCRPAMALNIKDPETDRLAGRLSALMGESITTAIKTAVRERIEREERRRGKASVEELLTIARRIASARDTRTPDEILGYDERGLPR